MARQRDYILMRRMPPPTIALRGLRFAGASEGHGNLLPVQHSLLLSEGSFLLLVGLEVEHCKSCHQFVRKNIGDRKRRPRVFVRICQPRGCACLLSLTGGQEGWRLCSIRARVSEPGNLDFLISTATCCLRNPG